MIAGRPTNLWLGLVTAFAGLGSVVLLNLGVDPELVAQLIGAIVTVLGAVIAIVAYQPPTLAAGDTYRTVTPIGQPNGTSTVLPSGAAKVDPPKPPGP